MKQSFEHIIRLGILAKQIILLLFSLLSLSAYAQKNYVLKVTQVSTNIGDCDGCCAGDSDPLWRLEANGDCTSYETTCNGCTRAVDINIFNNTYICLSDIPSSITTRLRGCENDGATSCSVPICDGNNVDNSWTESVPSSTGSSITRTATSGGSGCQSGKNFTMTYNWIVSGSWQTTKNQDANGNITNTTCGSAYSIAPSLPSNDSWRGPVRGHIKRCSNIYYVFTLSQDVSYLEIDMFNDDGEVDLYYGAGCACSLPNDAGIFDYDFKVNNAKAGIYVVRLRGGGNYVDLDIRTGSAVSRPSNDNISCATTIGGATIDIGESFSGNGNNVNATDEDFCGVDEPQENDNRTVWYKFTSGTTIGTNLQIRVTNAGGNNMTPDISVYKQNTAPGSCVSQYSFGGNLSNLGNDNGIYLVDDDAEINLSGCSSYTPNTTYYLQIEDDGFGYDEGNFNWYITDNGAAKGPDNICNAIRVGTGDIGVNQSATTSTYDNRCSTVNTGGYTDPSNADGNNATDWFYFTTPATVPAQYYFKFFNIGDFGTWGALEGEVYKKTGGTCPPTLSYVGSWDPDLCGVETESGGFCLEPSTTYYIMVDEENDGLCGGKGRYQLRVRGSNTTAGPNNICNGSSINATLLGNINSVSGSFSVSNQSNECANTESGESSGGQKTVWYYFTTGATVGRNLVVDMDKISGIDADLYLYRACGNVCAGPIWSNLADGLNDWDADATDAFDTDATINVNGYLKPNSTYFIRADGVDAPLFGLSGTFNLSVSWSGSFNGNDDFCNAWTVGNSTQVPGTIEPTNNDILDLGETITVGTFNNKSASTQEQCALDEPNNDDGDETVWFKLVTASNPGTEIDIDLNASNGSSCVIGGSYGWLRVYEADGTPALPVGCSNWTNTTNWFDGITATSGTFYGVALTIFGQTLGDNSKFRIECPKPSTTYYLQIENAYSSLGACDMSDFTMTVKDNGIPQAPNDRICNATVLGTPSLTNPQSLVGTYTKHLLQNQNNFCATNTEEPNPACFGNNNHSVWYKLPAAAAPGASDISNPGRKVAIINAYSNHAGGSEDEINLQLALYTNSNMASCPTNPTTGFALTSDIQGNNCAYTGPVSLDPDQLFQYSEYLTSACLTPASDYYLMVDGESLPLNIDFDALKKGWFEIEAYYPREVGDLPCSAVPFKLFGVSNGQTNGYDNAAGALGTGDAAKTNLKDTLYNNSNLCTTYTSGIGANQEPPTTFTTGDGNDNPGWVYFFAPPSGSVKITAVADPRDIMKDGVFDNIDLQLAIFEETTPGNCSVVRAPQSPIGSIVSYNILDGYGEEMYVQCLTPGKKYYLEIDGSASPLTQTRGIFDLTIEDYSPNAYAPNDEVCNAIPMDTAWFGTTYMWSQLNNKLVARKLDSKNWCADNLNEPGRPVLGGYNETGVWYKFVAPPSGKVHILAENTTYASVSKPSGDPNHIDLSLAVYELNPGYNCTQYANSAAMTLIQQDYENPAVTNGVAIVGTALEDEEMDVECLIPGKEYYLLVSGKKSAGIGSDWDYGRFNLYVTSDPRNPSEWDAAYTTNSGKQYLPSPKHPSNDSICGAVDLGTINSNTSWYQPFSTRKVPYNYGSDWVNSPPFNNFCASAVNDPSPGYQQDLVNVFGGNHQPVWFKFTTPATGAYDASRISVEVEVVSDGCSVCALGVCVPESERYEDCLDAGISVWLSDNGTCSGNLYEMGSDYDPVVFDESAEVHCLDPNTTYFVMVDGSQFNEEGNFNVRIRQIEPNVIPTNNFICSAKKLTTGAANTPASFWGSGAAYTYEDEFNICADTRYANLSASGTEPIPSAWDVVSPPSDASDATHTVWYSFKTPAAAGDYAVQIDVNSQLPWPFGDLVNPKIAVWESQDGSCNYTHPNGANMVEIASEYDPLAFWAESIKAYCLKPNMTYYVEVGGTTNVYGQDQGYFDITINDITPITIPANDNVCSAFNVGTTSSVGSVTISSVNGGKIGNASSGANNYQNYCTNLESGEPDPSAFDPDNTVWFKFTTPATAGKRYDITINANSDPAPAHNDGINLQLALYESSGGCSFANFTEIASDFDPLLFGETLTATCLKPNTTYYIQVDGTKGLLELFRAQGYGYFGLEVVTDRVYDAPANDNACNATNLGTVPIGGNINNGVWYYNNCATLETGEPDPVGDIIDYDIDKTVWFKFVAGRDADYLIELTSDDLITGDPIDLQVAVFRATNGCNDFTQYVQEAADYDPGFFSEDLTLPCVRSGETYFVQVDGSSLNMEGKFKIKITDQGTSTSAPGNDNFCSATQMTFSGASVQLIGENNKCASVQAGEPHAPADIQKSVWYKFQAPASGRVKITLHDNDGALRGLDPEMYVYEVGSSWNCASFAPLLELAGAYNPLPDIPVIAPTAGDEVIEYECFIPGWWYVVQVDGTTVGGPQGYFDLKLEDLLYPYTVVSGNQPANNDIANAVTVPVRDEQCVVTNGSNKIQGTGAWTTYNYGKPTKDLTYGLGGGACSIDDLCGDTWYKFIVPGISCGPGDGGPGASGSMPVYTPIVIQGSARYNANFTDDESKLHVIAYKGTPPALTAIGCGTAGKPDITTGDQFFNFELSEAAGTVIYLQVFGEDALDWNKNFDLCVSERKGFDECVHAAQAPPMQYGVEYCYNIKGATSEPANQGYSESCPLTGIPGLPDPDSDAPTENSVYFKFVTDNTCADYKLTFKYYFSSYSALNNKGISYSIYKDATPCDGIPAAAGTLDCQSFYNSNAGSYSYEITYNNNMYLSTANGIDTSSTYYIQIDGPGQTFGNLDGTIKIDQLPVCFNFVAIQYNDTSAGWTTCGDGWQHYHDGGTPKKYLFSLYTNGNPNLDGVAKIFYDQPATTWDVNKQHYAAAEYVTGGEASWVMRRYWDFVITSGSIDPMKPVKVRFYYIDSEKQAIINAMNNFFATYGSPQEGFEWFKSKNGTQFNPSNHIRPSWVTASYGSTSSASGVTGAPFTFTALDNQLSCNNVRYVELSGIPGFSGGSGATGNGPYLSPLPIELISFTGYHDASRNENVLLWSTASEINNEKFIVEKSVDAINFNPIGEVPGSGTTNERRDYVFIDTDPWLGNNYYRLTQVDFDGTKKKTNIINIVTDKGKLQTAIQNLYPNPTTGDINVFVTIANDTKLTGKVFNVIGEEIIGFEKSLSTGEHTFNIESKYFALGTYFLELKDESTGKKMVAKFVKQ